MEHISHHSTTLIEKVYLTNDILILRFEKPAGFTFTAGQFVQFLIPTTEKPTPRSYSISSAPEDSYLEFCIKLLPDGKASLFFDHMHEGEAISFRGPLGKFTIDSSTSGQYFIATGAGIAPIMSIVRDELEYKNTTNETRLLFGVRSEENVFWADRLRALRDHYPMFHYDITLSQPKPNGGWKGLRGRVSDHILHHLVKHTFYLCGNAEMVKDVRQILIENGVDPKQIRFEVF